MADQTEEELMAELEAEELRKEADAENVSRDAEKLAVPESLENPFVYEDEPERKAWAGALVELDGFTDERHAIHQRLAEIKPFLKVAID